MSAIDELFSQLRAERKALMPFITAGDPDLPFTAEVLASWRGRGASLCELGIPYSDPIADGPVIQASYTRALARQTKLARHLRDACRCGSAGCRRRWSRWSAMRSSTATGWRVTWPMRSERGRPARSCPICRWKKRESWQRFAAMPTSAWCSWSLPPRRANGHCGSPAGSTGFIYYVSVTGITGERDRTATVDCWTTSAGCASKPPLPICIGFGISQAEHVRQLAPVADGLIVGSAIVRRVAEAATRPREAVLQEVGEFVASLVAELNGV